LAETHTIAASVAALCRPGDLVVLAGEMGAGKTAFAKGFGWSLGVTEPITSPTFTLVHTYDLDDRRAHGAEALHHADLYRLDRTAEVSDLALDELAEDDGIVLVEWGDVVETMFGDHLMVHLRAVDDDDGPDVDDVEDLVDGARLIEISASGPSWALRWNRLVEACEAHRC